MASLMQKRLAEAVLDPKVKSVSAAGVIAGYNHVESAHRALNSVGGRKALDELKAKKAASLSEIRKKTIGELSKRINEDATDNLVLGSLKVTTDALATMPEPEIDPATSYPHLADPSWVHRHRRRALLRAYNLGRASVSVNAPPQDTDTDDNHYAAIDAIVLDPPTTSEAPTDDDAARLEELKQQAALLLQDAD